MKGMQQIGWAVGVVILTTGFSTMAGKEKCQTIDSGMLIQMDSNKDGRVSESEYIGFGTAFLKKSGKCVDLAKMQARFAFFDRNGDGSISSHDSERDCLLEKKIEGTWMCNRNVPESMVFVFMKNGQADIVRNSVSLRKWAQGEMTYRCNRSLSSECGLEIIVNHGAEADFHLKCIIQSVSDNKIELRMVARGRPVDSGDEEGAELIVLNRHVTPRSASPSVSVFGRSEPSYR